MSTEQPETLLVKRTCPVIDRHGKPCGKVYTVPKGSRSKGCPECCPRLDV